MNNQHRAYILEANYDLNVYNVHFKLALSPGQKYLFSLIQFCYCTLKYRKTYHVQS